MCPWLAVWYSHLQHEPTAGATLLCSWRGAAIGLTAGKHPRGEKRLFYWAKYLRDLWFIFRKGIGFFFLFFLLFSFFFCPLICLFCFSVCIGDHYLRKPFLFSFSNMYSKVKCVIYGWICFRVIWLQCPIFIQNENKKIRSNYAFFRTHRFTRSLETLPFFIHTPHPHPFFSFLIPRAISFIQI